MVLPEGSSLPDVVAFAGHPPQVKEWDPTTGNTRTLAILRDVPSTYTQIRLDPGSQTLTYSPLLNSQAVEVNLETGEARDVPKPTWPKGEPQGSPYRLELKPGQFLSPNGLYVAHVIEGGDPGKVILELPNLHTITPFNPCLPFGSYHSWAPDGKRLAVATMEPPQEVALELIDLSTATREMLLKRPIGNTGGADVSWAPDGEWIVFHDALVEAATGSVVTTEVGRVSHWGPDGQFLVSADEDIFRGWGALRVIEPGQAKVHLEADGRFIAWTTEGRLLYFDWPNGRSIPIGPRGCY